MLGHFLAAGPIIESKGMCAIFDKKGKKRRKKVKTAKKGKIFENLGKNAQNFEKVQAWLNGKNPVAALTTELMLCKLLSALYR